MELYHLCFYVCKNIDKKSHMIKYRKPCTMQKAKKEELGMHYGGSWKQDTIATDIINFL